MHARRLIRSAAGFAAVALLLATPQAWADDSRNDFLGGIGSVTTSSSGSSARVGASSTSSKGGGVAPAANGDYVSYPDNPVAEGAPVAPTQVCRLVHAGEVDFSNTQKSITVCYEPSNPATPAADTPAAAAAGVSPQMMAASAVAHLSVPAPQLKWSPDPANNEWNAWAIGLPIWVDFEPTTPISTSASASGIAIDMTATQSEIHIDWGDGTSSTCTRWGPMPRTTKMGTKSPWCGHTWQDPAIYTVTITSAWTVSWTALGQTGTLPLASTSTSTIEVAEFQAVVVG